MKNNIKKPTNAKKILLLLLICLTLPLTIPHSAHAEITTNDNWSIQVHDINLNSNTPATSNQKNQLTKAPDEEFTEGGKNYKIKTGFDNSKSHSTISLNISNRIIDFGILSPTNNIYRTSSIDFKTGKDNYGILIASLDHPLRTSDSNTSIPDSTCDNGSCSETTAAPWTNTLTYGFGYRCDNIKSSNCATDFKNSDYYKQFSDSSKNEKPEILSTSNTDKNQEMQITYKINIAKSQPTDPYSNTITYILIPGY